MLVLVFCVPAEKMNFRDAPSYENPSVFLKSFEKVNVFLDHQKIILLYRNLNKPVNDLIIILFDQPAVHCIANKHA